MPMGSYGGKTVNSLSQANATTSTQLTKTIAAVGTPEALAASGTYFRVATILAQKGPRTANAGNVYLGVGVTNDTQPHELAPGDIRNLVCAPGEKEDLNDWGLDVLNAGDGVIIIYS